MLNLHGLPLCVSGITQHFILFQDRIADHERRREAMKEQRARRTSERMRANRDMGFRANLERVIEEFMGADVNGDGGFVFLDLSRSGGLACTAKAA